MNYFFNLVVVSCVVAILSSARAHAEVSVAFKVLEEGASVIASEEWISSGEAAAMMAQVVAQAAEVKIAEGPQGSTNFAQALEQYNAKPESVEKSKAELKAEQKVKNHEAYKTECQAHNTQLKANRKKNILISLGAGAVLGGLASRYTTHDTALIAGLGAGLSAVAVTGAMLPQDCGK